MSAKQSVLKPNIDLQPQQAKQLEKKRIIFGVRKTNQRIDSSKQLNNTMAEMQLLLSEAEEDEDEKKRKNDGSDKKGSFAEMGIAYLANFRFKSKKSKWKATFDIFINLLVAYSCFEAIYLVSFSTQVARWQELFDDYFVQAMFALDIVFNFLTEYRDPETYETVRSLSKIAHRYVFKGSFFIDFLAIFPFSLFISEGEDNNNNVLAARLLRLFRLPRLAKLIDTARFNLLIKSLFENNSQEERIMMQYAFMYGYRIFRLLIIAIILTYFGGCIWYLIVESFQEAGSFYELYLAQHEGDNLSKLVICCYFTLTTISVVGYGDMVPQTMPEILTAIAYMLCGVAFFSYIMGSFFEIISNYQNKMGVINKTPYLRNWMTLLQRFTGNKPLSKSLATQIETHFFYFWQYDRLAPVHQHFETLNELPKSMKRKLMTAYLFQDIFQHYKQFFKVHWNRDSKFLYDMSFGFMPRFFDPSDPEDQVLCEEEQEVPEMYFTQEGKMGIGYAVVSGWNGKPYKLAKFFHGNFIVFDYYVLNNKRCEFLYMVLKPTRCFAISKKFWHKQIVPKYKEYTNQLRVDSFLRYNRLLKTPLLQHMKQDIEQRNKKRVYRSYYFQDKDEQNNFSNNRVFNLLKINMQGKFAEKIENIQDPNILYQKEYLEEDRRLNEELKDKMEGMQQEVVKFHKNLDSFTKICDDEMEQLLENIDLVTDGIQKLRMQQQQASFQS